MHDCSCPVNVGIINMDILHWLALRFKMPKFLALHGTFYLFEKKEVFFSITDSSQKYLVRAITLILGQHFKNVLICFQSWCPSIEENAFYLFHYKEIFLNGLISQKRSIRVMSDASFLWYLLYYLPECPTSSKSPHWKYMWRPICCNYCTNSLWSLSQQASVTSKQVLKMNLFVQMLGQMTYNL